MDGNTEAFRERRILRLKQVREQSKEIAKKLRTKMKAEKEKQLAILSTRKENEFLELKKKSLKSLQEKYENRASTLGSSHAAVSTEENLQREWAIQKEYNIRQASQRGRKALRITKLDAKNEKFSKYDLNRRRKSNYFDNRKTPLKEITKNVNYEECGDIENACGNILNIDIDSNTRSRHEPLIDRLQNNERDKNDKRTISVNDRDVLNYSNRSLSHQVSVNDIQKALCDCQPHFDNVISNVEQLLNNNNLDKAGSSKTTKIYDLTVDSKDDCDDRLTGADDIKIVPERNVKNTKYKPLNIVSDYLKNRDVLLKSDDIDVSKKDTEETSRLDKVKDVINHARYLSNVKLDVAKNSSNIMVAEKPVDGQRTKKIEFIEDNDKKFPANKRSKSSNKGVKTLSNPKSPKLKTKACKWKTKPQQSPGRTIQSYDQYNKFSKNMVLHDDDLVKKLPKGDTNAYENAEKEAKDEEMIAASILLARKNDKSKLRGKIAIEKIRTEEDYKSLLRELEAFDREERSIEKSLPAIIKRNIPKENERQRRINQYVEKLFGNSNLQNLTDSNDCARKDSGDQEIETVNVATWDVCSEIRTINVSEKSSIDSENSSRSIIIQTFSHTNNQVNTEKSEIKTRNDNKSATPKRRKKNLHKAVNSPSNSTDENIISDIPRRQSKPSTLDVKSGHIDKQSLRNHNRQLNGVSSSSSTISFEGLQIVIEVKKAKKESTRTKVVKSKSGIIHSEKEKIRSTEKMLSDKNVENANVQQKADSSESTCYMSPPEKMNTYLEQFFGKGVQTSKSHKEYSKNSKSNPNLKMINVGVNTDVICSEHSNVVSYSEKCFGTEDSTQYENLAMKNKSVQVSNIVRVDNAQKVTAKSSNKTSSAIKIDPRLEKYVKQLLGMPNSEIKKLSADVSDVTTPNSSIINISSNKAKYSQDFLNKVEKLRKFIQENYSLLEDLRKEDVIKNNKKSKRVVNKPLSLSSSDSSLENSLKDIELKTHSFGKLSSTKINSATSKVTKIKSQEDLFDSSPKECTKKQISPKRKTPEDNTPLSSSVDDIFVSSNKEGVSGIEKQIPVELGVKKITSPLYHDENMKIQDISDNSEMFIILHDVETDIDAVQKEISYEEKINSIDEKLNMLSEEYSQRILNISKSLNKVREDARSISASNSSSNSHEDGDIDFIPLLKDIPKPNSDEDGTLETDDLQNENIFAPTAFQFDTNKSKPPLVINNHSMIRNKNVLSITPHELSTIIEVDTPVTVRNSSMRSKNVDISPLKLESVLPNTENDVALKDILKMQAEIDTNLKPFISFKDFFNQVANSRLEGTNDLSEDSSSASNDSIHRLAVKLLKDDAISKFQQINISNLSSDESSSSKSDELHMKKILSSIKKDPLILSDISGIHKLPESSESLTPELENFIKNLAPDWGITTWKKIQEAEALSSSSSSSNKNYKEVHKTDSSIGLSTFQDDLELTDEFLKSGIIQNISNESLNKKLDELLNELITKKNENISKDNKSSTDNTHSKDKTQHRTSTPVQAAQSSTNNTNNNSSVSGGGSNGMFAIDSDLSSVRNVSNSEKNASSDDRLSVPNVSLRFGKLFDSNSSLQSDR